jgi:phospholipase C
VASAVNAARLRKIKHIVVLMMENRSFDHMLGYLQLKGMDDVDGLAGAKDNPGPGGKPYSVFEFPADQTAFHPPGKPFDKGLDPCHAPDCVKEQLSNGNRGFVKNFVVKKKPPAQFRNLPMGYFSDVHLPVYDHLARTYCVCDHWHSSIPGDTWPNRLYALAGKTAKPVAQELSIFANLFGSGLLRKVAHLPIYEVKAFTRQLGDGQWRWYSHDPATLRAADGRYRDFTHLGKGNFSFFNRREFSLALEQAEGLFTGGSFLDDVAHNQLRDVSWIDPNFIDVRVVDQSSNDDHPPSDITNGQLLVLDLYEALLRSRDWDDTLLVITYDEHGGFYDHVAPPKVNDGSGFPTYGVRVPAIVVGPRVQDKPCHDLFDHTSLIKTILLRFAKDPDKAIANMPKRIAAARDLSACLLDQPKKRDAPDFGPIREQLQQRRARAQSERMKALADAPPPPEGDASEHLTEFELEYAQFALAMRQSGLRPGHP